MASKKVGNVDVASGTLNDVDNNVFAMKDEAYCEMKLILSYYGDKAYPIEQEGKEQQSCMKKMTKRSKDISNTLNHIITTANTST